jgi:hypothetical protein
MIAKIVVFLDSFGCDWDALGNAGAFIDVAERPAANRGLAVRTAVVVVVSSVIVVTVADAILVRPVRFVVNHPSKIADSVTEDVVFVVLAFDAVARFRAAFCAVIL